MKQSLKTDCCDSFAMTSVQAAKRIQRQGEIFLSLGIAYAGTLIPINRKKRFCFLLMLQKENEKL
jgi:hypothetical protein